MKRYPKDTVGPKELINAETTGNELFRFGEKPPKRSPKIPNPPGEQLDTTTAGELRVNSTLERPEAGQEQIFDQIPGDKSRSRSLVVHSPLTTR